MRGRFIFRLLTLLACLAFPLACPGEEGGERRLLLYFEAEEGARFQEADLLLLRESLLVGLKEGAGSVEVLEASEREVPETEADKSELAGRSGADAWLWVRAGGSLDRLHLTVLSRDLLRGRKVLEQDREKRLDSVTLDLAGSFWADLVEAVEKRYAGTAGRTLRPNLAELRIRARPGTLIFGLPQQNLSVGPEGELRVMLSAPATYELAALCPGCEPVKRELFLEEGRSELKLEQVPAARWALAFYLNNLNFPGLEASWALLPGYLVLRAGLTSYLVGLALLEEEDRGEEVSLLVSYRLAHLNASLSFYLNREDSTWRLYSGFGLFSRLLLPKGEGFTIDPIAPYGLQPFLGLERTLDPKKSLYLEYAPLFYFTEHPELFRASLPPDAGDDGYVFQGRAVFDFLNFRLGLRFRL